MRCHFVLSLKVYSSNIAIWILFVEKGAERSVWINSATVCHSPTEFSQNQPHKKLKFAKSVSNKTRNLQHYHCTVHSSLYVYPRFLLSLSFLHLRGCQLTLPRHNGVRDGLLIEVQARDQEILVIFPTTAVTSFLIWL